MTDSVNHDEKIARMEELIPQILKANEVYYATGDEIMTNAQWDALYDELLQLEKTTGVILPNSPTQQVGHKIISNGQEYPIHNRALLLRYDYQGQHCKRVLRNYFSCASFLPSLNSKIYS